MAVEWYPDNTAANTNFIQPTGCWPVPNDTNACWPQQNWFYIVSDYDCCGCHCKCKCCNKEVDCPNCGGSGKVREHSKYWAPYWSIMNPTTTIISSGTTTTTTDTIWAGDVQSSST